MTGDLVLWSVAAVLGISFGICAVLVLTQRWHGRLSLDHDLTGAQKIHHRPVPRVGGLGVLAGLLAGAWISHSLGGPASLLATKLLLCAIPVFGAGLIEDLTKRVSVRVRLYASFASAALAAWAVQAYILHLNLPVIDELIGWVPAGVLFTCVAVGGMTNAVNIIDGLNGLASGAVGLMLTGLAALAWQAGDPVVMRLCLWGAAALVGFMLLNYPFGGIFLGDGGAYLAGFWLAECAVLLHHRNPEISTWSILLCITYPTWETIYTMYRRHVKQRVSSGRPDMVHFHHLIFRSVVHLLGVQSRPWLRHGASSLLMWALVALCQLGALWSWNNHVLAVALILSFVALYVGGYTSMGQRQRPDPVDVGLRTGESGA